MRRKDTLAFLRLILYVQNTYARCSEGNLAKGEERGKAMSKQQVQAGTRKTYVVYERLAGLTTETTAPVEVNVRDPRQEASKSPVDAFALYYYDVVDGSKCDTSKKYFIDGQVLSIDDVAKLGNRHELVSDMRKNGWNEVVRRFGGGFELGPYNPDKHELVSTR